MYANQKLISVICGLLSFTEKKIIEIEEAELPTHVGPNKIYWAGLASLLVKCAKFTKKKCEEVRESANENV